MTPKLLKKKHETAFPGSYFFKKNTLKCYGESIRTMRVSPRLEEVVTPNGKVHNCYVLHTKSQISDATPIYYFDSTTFEFIDLK